MKILIKSARITDNQSPHNNTSKDILISNGIIENIGTSITEPDAVLISAQELHVSQGWVDFKSAFYDPGHEERGGIQKGLDDLALGGFTHVGVLPTNSPTTDDKTSVEYKARLANGHCVTLHPIGAVSKKQEGKELAALFEMSQAGTQWFSDDEQPLNEGLLTRALLYSRDFNGRIIVSPRTKNFVMGAQVNEGLGSTRTGLKGAPAVDERVAILKGIEIAKYTDCPIHFNGISSASSLPLLSQAKTEGIKISADVHLMNVCFTEDQILDFDTRFKVSPVLREEADRLALAQALDKELIDALVLDHRPYVVDDKQVTFDEAEFGAPQATTAYPALLTKSGLSNDRIVHLLSIRNRETFGIKTNPIQIGSIADLTCYSPSIEWQLPTSINDNACNPFASTLLKGRAIAVINNGIAMINLHENV